MNKVAVSDEIAKLPDITSAGLLSSLHQAMAKDESGALKALLYQCADAQDIAA